MDPLTITASVLKISTGCITAGKFFIDIRNAWKRAPITLNSLCTELNVLTKSLSQIQTIILQDVGSSTDIFEGKEDIRAVFDDALTGCMVLVSCLEGIVSKIKKGILETSGHSWKAQFRTVWNETEIKELRGQIRDQQVALALLINLFQTDSLHYISQTIRKHDALLQRIVSDTTRLRQAHKVDVAGSIFEDASMQDSATALISMVHEDDQMEFEDVLLGAEPYRKAMLNIVVPVEPADSSKATAIGSRATPFQSTVETPNALTHGRSGANELVVQPEEYQNLQDDHMAALKYLRGCEELITSMKLEIESHKNANKRLEEQLAQATFKG